MTIINKLTIDMETRSRVDLLKCGMYRYAEDCSTDIMCIAFKFNDEPTRLWVPEKFECLTSEGFGLAPEGYFESMVFYADTIEAHNLGFESCMWHEIMHKRYGFPDLPKEKIRCSAAKVAALALPRSLEWACKAAKLDVQKDMDGRRIMLKMCKPNARTGKWNEDPKDFEKLCAYCMQDVEAEHALSSATIDLSDNEVKVWQLDQIINKRGVHVDIKAIDNLIAKVKEKETQLLLEVQTITSGHITSTRQVSATRDWLEVQGVEVKDLQKATVNKLLKTTLPDNVRRLLEIRQMLSKSSVSKLDAMKRMACKDNRVKGSILYHGARTGRFAGKGLQPHNMLRESYDDKDIDNVVHFDNELIEFVYGDVITTVSKCLRGMLTAAPGSTLFCADFSKIEAVVLAWLAGEKKALQGFRDKLDAYKVAAMDVYPVTYETMNNVQRAVGKTIVLACGYQGYIGAFRQMASVEVNKLSDDEIKDIILKWRKNNPSIVAYWAGVMDAAIRAIKTGKPHSYGCIKFGIRGRFLHIRLPSGRLLSYCDPAVMEMVDKYGRNKEVITFWGVASDKDKLIEGTKQWGKLATYGGKLTENIVQAVARDLLTEAMLRVEEAGYPIVMHVHDEIVSELPEDTDKTLEDFIKIMSELPEWAKGCPVSADGWQGKRYRK